LADHRQIYKQFREMLPPQVRAWLWKQKVARGNRRIRELDRHIAAQIVAADRRDHEAWRLLETRSEWEQFRDERTEALRHSLGVFPQPAEDLKPYVARTLEGDRFRIENLVFTSRPGVVVTANLYRPSTAGPKMPALVICHSHHDPKADEELQCMGTTWAQLGCSVLIMDLLGHGERRQHPFASVADYPGHFEVDRQDYYSRYTLGAQLQLIGESLIGWMRWDLTSGIDLLLTDPRVDRDRIVLIGSVAGGGDVAGVVGALDRRVAAVVAFNFGGSPGGDWDPTRCLAGTAHDGFWPWVILAAIAPRKLVYGREFAWEPQHDPVWQRLEKVYELYGARDCLRSVHGTGCGTSHGPEDSHCNNIGFLHRQQLYQIFQEWFGIPIPEAECSARYTWHELESLRASKGELHEVRPIHELAREACEMRITAARAERETDEPHGRVARLQRDLACVLGSMIPPVAPVIRSRVAILDKQEHISLEVEEGVLLHLELLRPPGSTATQLPVVIGVAQEGNRQLKQGRRELIAGLLQGGAAVCLAELRGVGDGRPGELYRGRISPSAEVSSASLALGESLVSLRVRDLRSVIAYLSTRGEVDQGRMILWGDSLAATNTGSVELVVPFDADPSPELGEPLGGVAALLGGIFEPNIRSIYIHGGLTGYASLLDEPFFYQPADSIIPGLLSVADLCDLVAALAPRPLLMEALVDGCNRRGSRVQVEKIFRVARMAYQMAGEPERLRINVESDTVDRTAAWLLTALYQ
jgi:dienelactone hydrolase